MGLVCVSNCVVSYGKRIRNHIRGAYNDNRAALMCSRTRGRLQHLSTGRKEYLYTRKQSYDERVVNVTLLEYNYVICH